MSRNLLWSANAWDDYVYWQGQDKKTLRRINTLLKDCQREPFERIGKPEALLHSMSGFYSRRIDEKNRLIYSADDEKVSVVACRDHY